VFIVIFVSDGIIFREMTMKKGFTLIELLIVIAIVAILAGAMVPMISTTREDTRVAKAHAELDAIKTAALLMHHDVGAGAWPCTGFTGAGIIDDNDCGGGNYGALWQGPYIDVWGNDPWSDTLPAPYGIYEYDLIPSGGDGTNEIYAISCGPNRVCNVVSPDSDDIMLLIVSDRSR